jgi:hypothetical protein
MMPPDIRPAAGFELGLAVKSELVYYILLRAGWLTNMCPLAKAIYSNIAAALSCMSLRTSLSFKLILLLLIATSYSTAQAL